VRKCGCFAHDGFQLSPEGLAQRELKLDERLAVGMDCVQVDSRVSVSGLRRDDEPTIWSYELLEQQYRRFLDGS